MSDPRRHFAAHHLRGSRPMVAFRQAVSGIMPYRSFNLTKVWGSCGCRPEALLIRMAAKRGQSAQGQRKGDGADVEGGAPSRRLLPTCHLATTVRRRGACRTGRPLGVGPREGLGVALPPTILLLIRVGCGGTGAPSTSTVGVLRTPRSKARAVTYGGQSRWTPSRTQLAKSPVRPIVAPRVISSSSVSPGPPSGGWLAKSASAYSTNLPPSAAQPDAAEERVE